MAQPRDLVGDAHELFGQFCKALIVGDQGLDLLSLFGGDALGELLALDVALENIIRALRGFGAGASLFEELPAEGATTEAVDGLDLLKNLLATLFEVRKRNRHGRIVSIQIQ